MRALVTVSALIMLPALCSAQPPKVDAVSAQGMSSTKTFDPNNPPKIGVLFKIKPDWHIYWKNPGDSGLPTSVKWTSVPEGVEIGELQYPAPVMFEMPGQVISYGYGDEVMLFADVKVRNKTKLKGTLTFKGTSKWVMCSDRCVQGSSPVSIELPIGKAGETSPVFEKYQMKLPKAPAEIIAATTKTTADGFEATIDLKSAGGDKPTGKTKPFFFPNEQVENFEVTQKDNGGSIVLSGKKLDKSASVPKSIDGVLVLPDGSAKEVTVNLG